MRAARNCPASDSSRIWEANYEDSSLTGIFARFVRTVTQSHSEDFVSV
jgi:hypothetical protein